MKHVHAHHLIADVLVHMERLVEHRLFCLERIVDDDLGAFTRYPNGNRPADSPARAAHQGDLVLQRRLPPRAFEPETGILGTFFVVICLSLSTQSRRKDMEQTMKKLLTATLGLMLMLSVAMAADISGTWNVTLDTPVGERGIDTSLQVKAGKVTGKLDETDITGTYAGGKLSISGPYYSEDAGYKADLKIEATVDGDKMTGQWEWDAYTGPLTGSRTK